MSGEQFAPIDKPYQRFYQERLAAEELAASKRQHHTPAPVTKAKVATPAPAVKRSHHKKVSKKAKRQQRRGP